MQLKEFKERLEKVMRGGKIHFTPEEKTFLYANYYNITGKYVNTSCGYCLKTTFGVLLHNINQKENETKGKNIRG